MPYTFAHPAAVLLVRRPLGRLAVPSALVIGSMAPDAWQFAGFVSREQSHSLAGLAWFCLPVGLALYVLFHAVLKQPLTALLPPAWSGRVAAYARPGLPQAPWHAVLVSLLVGALTHLAWDELIILHQHYFHGPNWPRHLSTLAGSVVLAWWIRRKLARTAPVVPPASLPAPLRIAAGIALVATAIVAAWLEADPAVLSFAGEDERALRRAVRGAAVAGAEALALALLAYCLLWRLRRNR